MSSTLIAPSPGQASTRFFKFCAQVLPPAKRYQTTYRRSRSKLNIKPDASFLPSKTETHDHIVFNPPPSMPNVYHTPTIFLPKSDKRRQLQNALSSTNLPATTSTARPFNSGELPPPVRQPYEKRYHVTPEQMDEMRALRMQDPYEWSVIKLAKKYDCSGVFVQWVIEGLAEEKAAAQKLVTNVVKSRWGPKRRIAREDRAIRKERWTRDA